MSPVEYDFRAVAERFHRPTLIDVYKAKITIRPHVTRTPLYHYPTLSNVLGCEIYVKHENHQPIGAFKIRNGVNFYVTMADEVREAGVVTVSTGNHGQSAAYGGRITGVRTCVVMPEGANPSKVESIQAMGAEVIFHGVDFDEAKAYCKQLAEEKGRYYLSPGNEPLIIAGAATETMEIIEDLPDVDVIIVPVGGGGGVSGACIVAKTINEHIEVVGVQSEAAPSYYQSWKESRFLPTDKMETFAEGLASRAPFELPLSIMVDLLDDFVLVSDDDLRDAILLLLQKTRNLAEGAGAASTAAAIKIKDRLRGKKVALLLSGGNLSLSKLKWVLERAKS
jgi:threonine dehydratase